MIRIFGLAALLGVACAALDRQASVGSVAFNHLAISVSDAHRSVAIYSRICGLE